jgi:hypothetical protein
MIKWNAIQKSRFSKIFAVIIFTFLAPSIIFATTRCENAFRQITVLPKFIKKIKTASVINPVSEKPSVQTALLDPEALKYLVQVFDQTLTSKRADLERFEDGFYLYLIDDTYRVAIMDRVAIAKDGRLFDQNAFVGTHDGIHIAMDRPTVLAAGEFSVRGDKVIMISNGSGRFRGHTENLDFAMKLLSKLGLKLTSETSVLDYSKTKISDPHETVSKQVELEIRIRQDPKKQALRMRTREVMRKLNGRRWQAINDQLRAIASKEPLRMQDAWQTRVFLIHWKSALESEATILTPYLEGRAQLEPILKLLETL